MAGGGKGGGSGHATNADLQSDEDRMNRMGKNFKSWAELRKKRKLGGQVVINYSNSPEPPKR